MSADSRPPSPVPAPVTAGAGPSGTTVLVLTLVAGFLSIAVGGCTASVLSGAADMGDSISDFQRSLGEYGDAGTTRREAAEIRAAAGGHVFFGLLQALAGIAGGVFAYRNYTTPTTLTVGGHTFKKLTIAGSAIAAAAVLTLSNTFAFFTAGVLNCIAAVLTFLQAKRL